MSLSPLSTPITQAQMAKARSEVAYLKEQLKEADARYAQKDAEVREG